MVLRKCLVVAAGIALLMVMHSAPARAAVQITVDPGAYTGQWRIQGFTSFITGVDNVSLEPGNYQVTVGIAGGFNIEVATDATVTVSNGFSGVGGVGTLTFNTTTVAVDPGAYGGLWSVFLVDNLVSGGRNVVLVPGVEYFAKVGGAGIFRFSLAADGTVTSLNTDAASGGPAILTFNTTTITVDPGSFTGSWQIQFVQGSTGPATVIVVPGVTYRFLVGSEFQDFSVAEPCAVDPTNFLLGGQTFDINCGAPDTDNDGVPDDTDNCPLIPNPDQVDQDLDGFGNACDPDLDGDGFANAVDNCPDIANADQADLDGDGAGDACDTDTDGDAVPDDVDNCPLVPNTDQADSDEDLLGDACDPDDDNDGIDDLIDNCPLDINPDQADFDVNGQGDICDGDIDGDGATNDIDLCPLSPLDQLVNADGCTGPQFISLQCNQQNFVQHGQFVSCVAHAANDAVDQGLITAKVKARFVKEAAHSNK